MRRFLFVGLGGIGQRHLRNLKQLLGDEAEICAYRVRGERAVVSDQLTVVPGRDLIEEYAIRVFHDLDQALAEAPEAVFVTNPSSLHVPVATAAVRAGCHLFLEKPVASDLAGVGELLELVERERRIAFVGYQLRFHPGFAELEAMLHKQAIGRVLAVHAEVGEYLPSFHPYEDYRRMYASRADLGGGVTVTQIHEIDFLYALFGAPGSVFSLGGQLSQLELNVEDVACSLLECRRPDGALLPIMLHQDYVQRPRRRSCRIVGALGTIEWSLSAGTLVRWLPDGEVAERYDHGTLPRNQLFLSEMQHFLDCLSGAAKPRVSLADGVVSLRIALALQRSQASRQPVQLDSVQP